MSRGDSAGSASAALGARGGQRAAPLRSGRSAVLTRSSIGQREQAPDLVGEHERLAVLGEGDEAYRPHRLPPSQLAVDHPADRSVTPYGADATRTRSMVRTRSRPRRTEETFRALDDVVDAGGQRLDVGRVDGREHRDPQLVAAQLAVRARCRRCRWRAAPWRSRRRRPVGEVDGADHVGAQRRVGDERGGERATRSAQPYRMAALSALRLAAQASPPWRVIQSVCSAARKMVASAGVLYVCSSRELSIAVTRSRKAGMYRPRRLDLARPGRSRPATSARATGRRRSRSTSAARSSRRRSARGRRRGRRRRRWRRSASARPRRCRRPGWTGTATPVEVSFCGVAYASTPASATSAGPLPGARLAHGRLAQERRAPVTACANFAPNSPKVANWARSRIRPNVATSQNAVVPPLPRTTS